MRVTVAAPSSLQDTSTAPGEEACISLQSPEARDATYGAPAVAEEAVEDDDAPVAAQRSISTCTARAFWTGNNAPHDGIGRVAGVDPEEEADGVECEGAHQRAAHEDDASAEAVDEEPRRDGGEHVDDAVDCGRCRA